MYVGNLNSRDLQGGGICHEEVRASDGDILKCIEFVDKFKLLIDDKKSAYEAVNFINNKKMNPTWKDFLYFDVYNLTSEMAGRFYKNKSECFEYIKENLHVKKYPPILPEKYRDYSKLFYSKLGAAYYITGKYNNAIKCFRLIGMKFNKEKIKEVVEEVLIEAEERRVKKEAEEKTREEKKKKWLDEENKRKIEDEGRKEEGCEKNKIEAEFREFWDTKLFVVDDTLRLKNIYRLFDIGERLEKTDFFRSCECMIRSDFYRKLGTACEILTYKYKETSVLYLGKSGPKLIREDRVEVPNRKNDEEKKGMTESDWNELILFLEENLVQESSESKDRAIALLKTKIKEIELNYKELLKVCNTKGENLKLLGEIVALYDKFITSELSTDNACNLAIPGNNLIKTNFFKNLDNKEKGYIYAKLGEIYYKINEFDHACLNFNKSGLFYSHKPIVNDDDKIVYDHNNKIFVRYCEDSNNPRVARIKNMYEYAYHKDEFLKEKIDKIYNLTTEEFLSLYSKFFKLDLSCGNIKNAQEATELASLFIDTPIFHKRSNQLIGDCYTKLSKAYYNMGNFGSALVFLRKNKKVYDYCKGENNISFETLNNEEREVVMMYGICCARLLYKKDEEMKESELNTYLQVEEDLETLRILAKLEATNDVSK